MKLTARKTLSIFASLFTMLIFSLMLICCNNGLSEKIFPDSDSECDCEAYVIIRMNDERTALPDVHQSDFDELTFSGIKDGGPETTFARFTPSGTLLYSARIKVAPGLWTFRLEGVKDTLVYSETITHDVIIGDNVLHFDNLTCEDLGTGNGSLRYAISFPTENVDEFTVSLIPYANGPSGTASYTQTYSSSTDFAPGSAFNLIYNKSEIPAGHYWLVIKAWTYKDYAESEKLLISSYTDIARIASGIVSNTGPGTKNGTCGTVHTVTYEIDGGTWKSPDGDSRIVKFNSTMSSISLPDDDAIEKDGYNLSGWYTNASFTGTKYTTSIPTSDSNITLYAKWTPPPVTELYVAQTNTFSSPITISSGGGYKILGTGSNTTGDGSIAHPFASITKALETLNGEGRNCTIYVYGTIKECLEISSSVKASTLNIKGSTTLEPIQTIIDGNNAGTVLSITASFPVTIENITIQKGSGERGGGVFIENNATLNKCIIQNCKATRNGGGIYVSGGADIISCTIENNESTSQSGGGICVVGTSGTFIDTCTIQGNTANYLGGGIYNEGACTLEGGTISGNISTNDTNTNGILCDSGTFTLKGNAPSFGTTDKIYLKSGKTIKLDSSFSASGNVATITPESYTNPSSIRILEGENVSTLYNKFSITSNGAFNYSITSGGYLKLGL